MGRSPNERAPFRFHGAVVVFVDRCLSTTRNLAASNKHLAEFFSGRSWPKIGPGTIFSGFLKSLIFSLEDLRYYNSESHRNLLAGIFEIRTVYGNIAFPMSPVLGHARAPPADVFPLTPRLVENGRVIPAFDHFAKYIEKRSK